MARRVPKFAVRRAVKEVAQRLRCVQGLASDCLIDRRLFEHEPISRNVSKSLAAFVVMRPSNSPCAYTTFADFAGSPYCLSPKD